MSDSVNLVMSSRTFLDTILKFFFAYLSSKDKHEYTRMTTSTQAKL